MALAFKQGWDVSCLDYNVRILLIDYKWFTLIRHDNFLTTYLDEDAGPILAAPFLNPPLLSYQLLIL